MYIKVFPHTGSLLSFVFDVKQKRKKKKKITEKFKAANVIFRLMLETWGRVNETDIGY